MVFLPECSDLFRPGDENRRAQSAGEGHSERWLSLLGAAETAIGLTDVFKMVIDKPGLYLLHTARARVPAQQTPKYPRPRLVAISGGR